MEFSVRYEAQLDQLKARMIDDIRKYGEDWIHDIDAFCSVAVKDDNILASGLARFAKIGMCEVLKSFTPMDEDEATPTTEN